MFSEDVVKTALTDVVSALLTHSRNQFCVVEALNTDAAAQRPYHGDLGY